MCGATWLPLVFPGATVISLGSALLKETWRKERFKGAQQYVSQPASCNSLSHCEKTWCNYSQKTGGWRRRLRGSERNSEVMLKASTLMTNKIQVLDVALDLWSILCSVWLTGPWFEAPSSDCRGEGGLDQSTEWWYQSSKKQDFWRGKQLFISFLDFHTTSLATHVAPFWGSRQKP